jgi:hypothetical protein
VTKGQLAILPVEEGRKAERRIVNLAARLREPGASVAEVDYHQPVDRRLHGSGRDCGRGREAMSG